MLIEFPVLVRVVVWGVQDWLIEEVVRHQSAPVVCRSPMVRRGLGFGQESGRPAAMKLIILFCCRVLVTYGSIRPDLSLDTAACSRRLCHAVWHRLYEPKRQLKQRVMKNNLHKSRLLTTGSGSGFEPVPSGAAN